MPDNAVVSLREPVIIDLITSSLIQFNASVSRLFQGVQNLIRGCKFAGFKSQVIFGR